MSELQPQLCVVFVAEPVFDWPIDELEQLLLLRDRAAPLTV
jgi:hypothetical protein